MRKYIFILYAFLASCTSNDSIDGDEILNAIRNYPGKNENELNYFWAILNASKDKALSRKSPIATSEFFRISESTNIASDVDEFFSESLEIICSKNPLCFNKAIDILASDTQQKIIKRIKNPMFLEQQDMKCLPRL